MALSWHASEVFSNAPPIPAQLRACFAGCSGSGKTKLLIRYLLDGTLDYERLVLCSLLIAQQKY